MIHSKNIFVILPLLALFLFFPTKSFATREFVQTHTVIVKRGEAFQGVSFPVGSKVSLYTASKGVAAVELSENFSMNGILLKAGTSIEIWEDGTLFQFSTRDGQRVHALTFGEHEATLRFSRSGVLESINLRKPKLIHGVKFAENYQLEFHPNGKPSRGTLAEDQAFAGLHLKAAEVQFFPSGKIRQAKLAKESKFREFVLRGDPNPANPNDVEFWENGILKRGILGANANVQGYICGPGPITFFETGKVRTLTIGDHRKVFLNAYAGQQGVEATVKPGDSLNINEAGVVIGLGSH
jgi:hypothetical protein